MNHILLINPSSSAGFLSDTLRSNNVKTVAVMTFDFQSHNYLKLDEHYFDRQLYLPNATCSEIIDILKDEEFDFVVNGTDASAPLTDAVASYFTPKYANNPESAELRCNKYLINKALAQHGISYIQQILYDPKSNELTSMDPPIPCFVKPLASGASIGAKRILSKVEFTNYFTKSNSTKNPFDPFDVEKYIIAELAIGDEYFIDTFSLQGKTYVSSIQRYQRKFINNTPVALYSEICSDHNLCGIITDYAVKCLEILGVKNGFTHTDLIMLADGTIKLIEMNSRIAGVKGASNMLAVLSGRPSQIDLMLGLLYHKNPGFPNNNSPIGEYFARINIYNFKIFDLANLNSFSIIRQIVRFPIYSNPGAAPIEEISLTDLQGFVLCSHHNEKELHQQINQLLSFVGV